MTRSTLFAWSVAVLALIAYLAVGWFGWTISRQESDRAANFANAQDEYARQAQAARLHAAVADTVSQRQALEGLIPSDILSVAGMLADAGTSAGVSLQLSNALPESAPSSSDANPIYVVGFDIQAQGSFSALMRAIAILETLPIAASVERFDVQTNDSGATPSSSASGAAWHMSAYIRALTTAPISS